MELSERLVKVALDEKGAADGSKYVRWYNGAMGSKLSLSAAWCAIFVSWCARQAGISTKKIPNFAGCTTGRRLFQNLGFWKEAEGYTPKRGDLILFDWDGDTTLSEHVGIVTGVTETKVSTVEGNSGKTVREKSYNRSSKVILGYASWEEKEMTEAETKKLVENGVETATKAMKERLEKLEQEWKLLGERMEKMKEEERYDRVEEVPEWGRETIKKLMEEGTLKGGTDGKLGLSGEMVRLLVILERREEKKDESGEGILAGDGADGQRK